MAAIMEEEKNLAETYLTADEVATRLRVSMATVNRLLNKGVLEGGFKVGDQWRLSVADLNAYIKKQQQRQK